MKKKALLMLLSGALTVGVLAACGDVEDEPMQDDPMMEDEGDFGDDDLDGDM
ncbi:hypothetical protein LGQ02_19790 [Bacillus shivajii]|uniref:hypothetical protein n=1 Tax=Bacillus shivajii TaxID=1983719 RepID=UPI001CFC13C1|nr:hypothetical protein [Bacillus shivajii]UCZ52995.1 hypothetical protein LGQ02_19790 [Bacillus shivajii]